jgi:outer membrane protein OmpA-like peptidoglycan-associated protein
MKTTRRRIGPTYFRLVALVSTIVLSTLACAQEPVTKDVTGKDHPLVKRYEGAVIVAHSYNEYDEYRLIVGKALNPTREESGGRRVEAEKELEGRVTRITYYAPKGRSVLEVFRNYEQELKSKNAETLFTGSGASGLGYDFGGAPQYDQILEGQLFSYSHTGARYGAYQLGNTHVAVYAAAFENGAPKHPIEKGQTAVQVDIIEAAPMQEKMVQVNAAEMEKQIDATGKVTLYGIYFDTNKAEVKPESEPTLSEIASLLAAKPALRILVVGHTDNVGSFETNKTLSQKRAEAVVAWLGAKKIDAKRMFPVGASFSAPVATNATDEGRAKNRRVELVEMQAAQ